MYHECPNGDVEDIEWMRASASIPVASRPVKLGGKRLLDGGVSDPIPVKWMLSRGYEKNVVVLTRDVKYRKKANPKMQLFLKAVLHKYPAFLKDLEERHIHYNETLEELASLDAVDKNIADLKTELQKDFISDADLKELATKVEKLSVEVMTLIGHRLTSLTLIPTTYINGIPSIELLSLQYTPQVYTAVTGHQDNANPRDHGQLRPVLDHKPVANAKSLNISTEKNKVSYKMSPSIGVLKDDIKLSQFEGIKSQNVTKSTPEVLENALIEVVDYSVDGGILTIQYKH